MTVIETTWYRAPLALALTDAVNGAVVSDGLTAEAWPTGDPGAARSAGTSPVSGLLHFGGLPGLWASEEAVTEGSSDEEWPVTAGRSFEVRVVDLQGRYLPTLLSLSAPQPTPVTVPLFSAVTRPVPSGYATVYGEVSANPSGSPAAWAIVELSAGGTTYRTVTDGVGRYVLYLPYPEALPPLTGSPPAGGPLSWPVSVQVAYQPVVLVVAADATSADPPVLSSILAQGPAAISSGGGTTPVLTTTLSFGAALLLMLEVIPA